MDYSSDEIEPPEWLNEDFLKHIIQLIESNQNVQIIEHTVTPAVTKGNHFASIIFRANVKFCDGIKNKNGNENDIRNESYIIKAMPEINNFRANIIKETVIFETEIEMYTKTLPYFEKILKQNNINIELSAKILYHTRDEHEIIVMNDLKKLGYILYDDGWLNYEDYKMVIKKLALWHALSYKINLEDDSSIVQYYIDRGIMVVYDAENLIIFKDGLESFEKLLNDIPDTQKYSKYFKNCKSNVTKECIRAHRNVDGKFNVLNHGDFNLKNMMLKQDKDTGKYTDALFIDFQLCSWGSPAIDIINSLYMMADPEIKYEKRDEIIFYYYNCFTDSLKQLNFNGYVPTYEELQIEFLKLKKFELFVFSVFAPFMYHVVTGSKIEAEELYTDENKLKNFYSHPDYVNDMKKTLPFLLYNGYF